MRRPALVAFIFLILGIVSARYLEGAWLWAFPVAVAVMCFYMYRKTRRAFVMLFSIASGVGFVTAGSLMHSTAMEVSGDAVITAAVYDTSITSSGGQALTVDCESADFGNGDEPFDLRGIVYTQNGTYLKRGDIIKVSCYLEPPDTKTMVSGFDLSGYLLMNKLSFTSSAQEIYLIGHKSIGFRQKLLDFRDNFCDVYDLLYPSAEAGVVKAITTGNTSYLSDNIRQRYSDGGIAHVLSVSGMHTAIIAAMLMAVLRNIFGLGRKKTAAIIMVFLAVYAVFAGGQASIVRAVIMMDTYLIGTIIGRKGDSFNTLSVAGIIILLLNPYSLWNVGFQLSFVSVAALILFGNIYKGDTSNALGKTKYCAFLSLFVTLCTFPITAYYFYEFSIFGFISNLLIVPTLGFTTGMGVISGLGGFLSVEAGRFLAGGVFILLKFYLAVCGLISLIPFSVIHMGRPNVIFMAMFYALILSVVLAPSKKQCIVCSVVLTSLCLFSVLSNKMLFKLNTISFMPANYGGGVVIETYDGHIYMAGQESRSNSYSESENMAEYIKSIGAESVDCVFVTSNDAKSLRFARKFMNEPVYIDNLVMCGGSAPEDTKFDYDTVDFVSENKGVNMLNILAGDFSYLGGGLKAESLYPFEEKSGVSGTTSSSVLRFSIGDTSLIVADKISLIDLRYFDYVFGMPETDVLYVKEWPVDDENEFGIFDGLGGCIIAGENNSDDESVLDIKENGAAILRTDGKNIYYEF